MSREQERPDEYAPRVKPGSYADITRRFSAYKPNEGALVNVVNVREMSISLADYVSQSNPDPRMFALFLTNLEQAVFWANKAITSNNEVAE